MRVLLTHHFFPPDFAGGGEYVALGTARGLMARGVDVRVLTTGDPTVSEYEGIPTVRLPIHRYRFNLAVRKIAEMARDVDLIQTFNYHACLPSLVAGKWVRKPVVCLILGLFQDVWKVMRPPLVGDLWSAWEKFMVTRDFSRVIFISEYSRDVGMGLGVPADRAVADCPGIALESYGPAQSKEDVVFFTAKLEILKGVYDVLEVARALPHVRFRIMGWGPDEARIRGMAPRNVEFVPYEFGEARRGGALCKQFAAARIFFFPTRAETFGIALVEAMASGCAVISSIPLEFEGIRIAQGDRQAMIRAVDALWADREATARMGRRNIELAQRYSWDRFTDTLLSVYAEILDGSGPVTAPLAIGTKIGNGAGR